MTRDHDRLAQRVRARRAEMHLDLDPVARSIGMSKDTWAKVERGQPVRETTYGRIDKALHWAAGSCVSILEGREAIPVESLDGESGTVVADLSRERLSEEIGIAVQDATIATTNLSAEEIRKLNQRVLETLKRRGVI